jgi:hypothetical protein
MATDIATLLNGLGRRSGATDRMIAESEKQLGAHLPPEYVDFLRVTNGGEGFIGDNAYAMFWNVEDLASLNGSYEVLKYAPGLLIVGSDGGGEAYGFDTRAAGWPVVRVPFVGMNWSAAEPMGKTFNEFLRRLHEDR